MNLIPTVIEQSSRGERAYDIYSFIKRPHHYAKSIDDNVANSVIAQLLFLDAQDSEKTFTCTLTLLVVAFLQV